MPAPIRDSMEIIELLKDSGKVPPRQGRVASGSLFMTSLLPALTVMLPRTAHEGVKARIDPNGFDECLLLIR